MLLLSLALFQRNRSPGPEPSSFREMASGRRLKAILLDMDGTICDTDHLHLTVFAEMLLPHKIVVDKAYFSAKISGRSNELIIKDCLPHFTAEEAAKFIKVG